MSAAARAAGINRATWTRLEDSDGGIQDYIYGAVERVLGWAPGSIDEVLDGGDPTPAKVADRGPPAGDRAITLQVIEILRSRFSAGVKIQMIEDVIERDFVPDADADADAAEGFAPGGEQAG